MFVCVFVAEETSDAEAIVTSSYEPRKALKCALEDWLPVLYKKSSDIGT